MPRPRSTAFAEIIRGCRVRAGLTIEELSEASGVSVRAISNIERGVSRIPHRRNLVALAKASGADDRERADLDSALRTQRREASCADAAHADPPAADRDRFIARGALVVIDLRGHQPHVIVLDEVP